MERSGRAGKGVEGHGKGWMGKERDGRAQKRVEGQGKG